MSRQGRDPVDEPQRPGNPIVRWLSGEPVFSWALFLVAWALRLAWIDRPVSVDEVEWIRRGASFLLAMSHGNWANTHFSAHPGVTDMWLVAGSLVAWATAAGTDAVQLAESLASREVYPPLSAYIAARIPFSLITALSTVAIYRWARRTHGDAVARIAALWLTFEPFWLAYNRLITTDALQAHLMTLSLLAFLRYARAEGARWAVISGILGGLAIVTKLPALVTWPILGLWLLLLRSTVRDRRQALALWIAWLPLAGAAAIVVWPALWVALPQTLQRLLQQVTEVELGARAQFYLGHTVDAPGAGFYPLAWLLRTSPLTVLIVAFTLIATGSAWRRDTVRRQLVLLWAVAIVTLGAALTTAETKFDRYLLPVYPAMAFIIAAGIEGALQRAEAAERLRPWAHRGTVALCVLQAGLTAYHMPALLAYFNPLVGGAQAAARAIMVGNGEGMDLMGRWLSEQPGARERVVAAWYPSTLAPYFEGKTIELNQQLPDGFWPWASAHHVVLYVNQIQRGLPNEQIIRYLREQPATHVVKLAGIEYAWAYDGPIVLDGPLPEGVQPLDFVFEGQLRLIGWEPPRGELRAGEEDGLRLYWEVVAPPREDLSVFVGLWDAGSADYRGRHDRPPVDGFLPLKRWQPGLRVRDAQRIRVAADAPPGTYELELAIFSPGLGRNLTVARGDGTPVGDRVHLMPITIVP
ncbi:MAG: hypothetical protein Kow0047_28710 [Anaerolineae bacterium]